MSAFDLDRVGGARGLRSLVDEILAAGQEALGMQRAILRRLRDDPLEKKPDRSPVTEADRFVEDKLRVHITQRFPSAGFFGEESGESTGSSLRFIVDPIDGTRAFLRGLHSWSVLVGVEHEGEPVVGIAYMPVVDELFVGVKGGGAELNGRSLHLSQVTQLEDALVCHGGLEQFQERPQLLAQLGRRAFTSRGFADFDGYRHLLKGQADAMVDPGIKPYDICPAAVLVREAGGRLTSFEGEDTIFGGSAIASNGRVHDELLELTR